MSEQQIKVLRRFPYRGAYRNPGDVISVHPKFAKIIVLIGKAENYEEPLPEPEPEKKPEPEPPQKTEDKPDTKTESKPAEKTQPAPARNYSRRNMTAQKSEAAKNPEAAGANTYKTTDQKAD